MLTLSWILLRKYVICQLLTSLNKKVPKVFGSKYDFLIENVHLRQFQSIKFSKKLYVNAQLLDFC